MLPPARVRLLLRYAIDRSSLFHCLVVLVSGRSVVIISDGEEFRFSAGRILTIPRSSLAEMIFTRYGQALPLQEIAEKQAEKGTRRHIVLVQMPCIRNSSIVCLNCFGNSLTIAFCSAIGGCDTR